MYNKENGDCNYARAFANFKAFVVYITLRPSTIKHAIKQEFHQCYVCRHETVN